MLSPFARDLLASARVGDPELSEYYPAVQALDATSKEIRPLRDAIPDIKGRILLEGDSGLGKSMFLRVLLRNTTPTAVYLSASECDKGVIEAIQQKLLGRTADADFLESIIYRGGLKIVIDGLNEVSVETREKIVAFLSSRSRANILLATQPLQWKRPVTARVFVIQPLKESSIREFLITRYPWLGKKQLDENEYAERCNRYLDTSLDGQPDDDRLGARIILSNPMDLITAAQLLANGDVPTLTRLQEQQFDKVADYYKQLNQRDEFPLPAFARSVYESWRSNERTLDHKVFYREILALVDFKMAIERNEKDADSKSIKYWVFRHEKIRDFFLMKYFLANPEEAIPLHIDDSRFRGVYILLASLLPLNEAQHLRDLLVERAAETKDHNLADAVVQVYKFRGPSQTRAA